MSRLVSGVITEARDRHPAFTEQQTPSGPAYRFLASYVNTLRQVIEQHDSTYLGYESTLTYTLPLVEFAAGMALGAGRRPIEVVALDPVGNNPQRRYPLELISRDARFAVNRPSNAVWEENGILYLNGREGDWTPYGTIEVQVVVERGDADIATLQAAAAVLPIPDGAANAVVDALAAFMARRGGETVTTEDKRLLIDEATKSEARFQTWITQRAVGRSYFTQDVWP